MMMIELITADVSWKMFLGNNEKLNVTLTSLMNQVDQRPGGSATTALSNFRASHQIR